MVISLRQQSKRWGCDPDRRTLVQIQVELFPVNLLPVRVASAEVVVYTRPQYKSPSECGLGPREYGKR